MREMRSDKGGPHVSTTEKPRPPAQTVEEFVGTYNEHDMVANHALIDPAFVRYGRITGWQPMV